MRNPTKKTHKTILAVESSCDETAASVLSFNPRRKLDFTVLSSVVRSQIAIHKKTGGVIPEAAARAHIGNIAPVVKMALQKARVQLETIDYFAVTHGPGLIVSLLVGTEFMKTLALAYDKPLIGVNHLEGHLLSPVKPGIAIDFPMLSVVVSGGHTLLVLQKDLKRYKVIGSTVDDAAGEAFDKVARVLGLSYPGGPAISKAALEGEVTIDFPRAMLDKPNFNFSFSGLKTAVIYKLKEMTGTDNIHDIAAKLSGQDVSNIAASFQEAVVDVLVKKTLRAAKDFSCKTISLSGGVAANRALKARLEKVCGENSLDFIPCDIGISGDNAEMIAKAAYFKIKAGKLPKSYRAVKANPSLRLT